jgi:hypothetical protein
MKSLLLSASLRELLRLLDEHLTMLAQKEYSLKRRVVYYLSKFRSTPDGFKDHLNIKPSRCPGECEKV